MTRFPRSLLVPAIALLLCGFDRPPDKPQRGMTPQQVRDRLGSPQRIARQILYHRHREQWIYDRPIAARLLFDCPRGQVPQLLWIQELADPAGPRP